MTAVLYGSDLAGRVARCLPAATYELETLVELAGIHASTDVETAAVSCGQRPRMLVNPDFVERRCRRDEHLFLLVMHELWHVILAHTSLYPRPSFAHNVAFDAVINAGLARLHPEPEFRGFFDALNAPDRLPGALLRPPPGWPLTPRVPRAVRGGARRLVEQLYDPDRPAPTYAELLLGLGAVPEGDAVLLGSHGPEDSTTPGPLDDPLFGEVVRRMVAAWPPPPMPLGGRDLGGHLNPWQAAVGAPPPRAARSAFDKVLRRVLGPPSGPATRRTERERCPAGPGVLVNPHDRLAPARTLLGAPGLWAQPHEVTLRARRREPSAGVYLDVSGSMFELLEPLLGMLAPYVRTGRARLWQFSTSVAPLRPADVYAGRLETTGGTEIDCVLTHLLASGGARQALVLTDGYTGSGRFDLCEQIRATGCRIHVVLPCETAWTEDLAGLAASMTVLPSVTGRRSGA